MAENLSKNQTDSIRQAAEEEAVAKETKSIAHEGFAEPTQTLPGPSSQTSTAADEFDQYYVRQVTADFAEDIEKLRNANDFKESSVPVLVQTLKQGAVGFTEDEKKRAMKRVRESTEGREGQ